MLKINWNFISIENEKLFEIESWEVNQDMVDYVSFLWEFDFETKKWLQDFLKIFKKEFKNFEIKIIKDFENKKTKRKLMVNTMNEKQKLEFNDFILEKIWTWTRYKFFYLEEDLKDEKEIIKNFPIEEREKAKTFFNLLFLEKRMYHNIPYKSYYDEETDESFETEYHWLFHNVLNEINIEFKKFCSLKENEKELKDNFSEKFKTQIEEIENILKTHYSFYEEWKTIDEILSLKYFDLVNKVLLKNDWEFLQIEVQWDFLLKGFILDNFTIEDFKFLKKIIEKTIVLLKNYLK